MSDKLDVIIFFVSFRITKENLTVNLSNKKLHFSSVMILL